MRSSDADILIVPGYGGSGPDHWQTRWQQKLSTARRVEQENWDHPDPESWIDRIVEAVRTSHQPVVVVAHSLGVVALAKAAPRLPPDTVQGAFLVAMADIEELGLQPSELNVFAPIPHDPLPFPSVLVASRNDPYCSFERADEIGFAWGSAVIDAGEAGHVNPDSGYGPWPEGLMRFAGFLRQL